ncbi:MAG: C25 family cysteine peptidase [Bacteroidetes bacterium]|nr:C25 family cysteine peptidase [Bacteroidota bacterium]MCL2302677.1 C25 family cysteine peptidase [Lentimicrobiaceae bacterium]
MKRLPFLILLFVCQTLFIPNLFAQEMTYSYLRDGNGMSIGLSLKSYEVTPLSYRGEVMHEITLSGIFIPNEAGMPNLPIISRLVAIPKGAKVRVSIKSMKTERLENINIAPALKIQAIPEEPVTDYVKNAKAYTTNAFYPQNPVEISEVTSLREVNAIMVGITPFQFNPVTKELIVINNIELKLEYIGGSKEYGNPKYRSPWFDPILKNVFLNYDMLPEMEYAGKNAKDGDGCEYLIVIPNREDFRPFAEQIKEFRTKQGIYTKIMNLNEMGVTTTDQLKSYFHNAYNTWDIPPVAVLLMGDHHTDMAIGIPAETIPHSYSGSCITDNQYADVTGNKLPDMVFGRMAAENEAQMAILVSKVLEYETLPCMDPAYYQKPITALGWQTERWFQICSEAVGGYWRKKGKAPVRINDIYEPPQNTSVWSTNQNTTMVTHYFGPGGTGYIPASPTELGGWSGGTVDHMVTAVNNGAFALQHRNHGFEDGWGEPAFKSSHISQLTNVGKMTYLFTINCLTGKFNHTPPCFGEVFHRHTYQGQNAGCVGFLGPTEVSYSFVNDVYAWGMYDLYDPGFLPTFGPQGPHSPAYSGNWMPAFGNVAGKYFLYQSSWPVNSDNKEITYQMFTAHSDVFLRLFTEVPQSSDVSHAEVSLAGNSNFLISANEGTLIALTAKIGGNLEILNVATATGAMQVMTIPSDLSPATEINVVVTGQNFLRYEAVVMVVPAEGPYVVPIGYTVADAPSLTYTSVNSEIAITLKNIGIEPNEPATVTISCNDPQLIIINATAPCGSISPDGTTTANFRVTIANNIPDNKIFPVTVTVIENGKARSWESGISLKAFAPKFSLEKILVNGVENGNLEPDATSIITVIVANKGGAAAHNITGNIEIVDQYVTLVCENLNLTSLLLPAGESIKFSFAIVASSELPIEHVIDLNLSLSAQYGISFATPFTVSSSNDYCVPWFTNCNNDKFTSVVFYKTSDPSNLLINNTDEACSSSGYQDYTHISVNLEPGQNYTIKLKVGFKDNVVRGWVDFNGNKIFDNDELLINMFCDLADVEYSDNFTIPQDLIPGTYRFRLRTSYDSAPNACTQSSNWGQTHDYTIVISEIYPRVQNVKAELEDNDIIITWEAPEEEIPVGYNIYRNGDCLNETPLTNTNFTEENIGEGVYVYHVTAVFVDNKEALPQMSNVICHFNPPALCETPVNSEGAADECIAVITWSEPETDGILLGYNIYRDKEKIAETSHIIHEYRDAVPENGIYVYQVSAIYGHCEESEWSDEITIEIDCVGINEVQTDAFQIFPNPANNSVTFKGNGLNRIEFYDLQGRKLAEYNNIKDELQVSVSKYESGIYFVKMYTETNQMVTKRLIITK